MNSYLRDEKDAIAHIFLWILQSFFRAPFLRNTSKQLFLWKAQNPLTIVQGNL